VANSVNGRQRRNKRIEAEEGGEGEGEKEKLLFAVIVRSNRSIDR
jgi:hypothetical protein